MRILSTLEGGIGRYKEVMSVLVETTATITATITTIAIIVEFTKTSRASPKNKPTRYSEPSSNN